MHRLSAPAGSLQDVAGFVPVSPVSGPDAGTDWGQFQPCCPQDQGLKLFDINGLQAYHVWGHERTPETAGTLETFGTAGTFLTLYLRGNLLSRVPRGIYSLPSNVQLGDRG